MPMSSELRQRLQLSEKAIEQANVLLQERDKRLIDHQAQHNGDLDDEQLANALTELQNQFNVSEQRCAELRAEQAEDQRRQNANQALAQQIADAYAEYQRWARLNALIGSATGDTFRKIAQAYNLDLLVHHANVQLRQLVRRYRLKRGGSMLGLLVMDTEMGDELRSVHSLSGGETFLVSLALALGLASMASSTLEDRIAVHRRRLRQPRSGVPAIGHGRPRRPAGPGAQGRGDFPCAGNARADPGADPGPAPRQRPEYPGGEMNTLYSFRRCPYAMRARMALRYSRVAVDIVEVSLKAKPAEMLALSSKGTVPVLSVDGLVIDESLRNNAMGAWHSTIRRTGCSRMTLQGLRAHGRR